MRGDMPSRAGGLPELGTGEAVYCSIDALIGAVETNAHVLLASWAIEVTRGGEDTSLGKPVDGLAAILAAGGPELHAGIGVVDGKAGVDKRVHEHRATGGVAVALKRLGVVVVKRGDHGGLNGPWNDEAGVLAQQ